MNYMSIDSCSIENGTGIRVSLFVSGCNLHCTGCQNPEAQSFTAGTKFTEDTVNEIIKLLEPNYIDGLTILGGEPLARENFDTVYNLVKTVKQRSGKSVWIYTGYTYENLVKRDPGTAELLELVDVLVDGPYIQDLRDVTNNNAFRGSTNQRVIDLQATLKNKELTGLSGITNNKM